MNRFLKVNPWLFEFRSKTSDFTLWRGLNGLFVLLGFWVCWWNSVNSSMNQIWNHMMFRLLRHLQWTEMTFQIEGWYVTGLDIVKWHGRWEKHAFMKVLHHNNIPSYRTLSWSVCGCSYRPTSTIPQTYSRLIHFMFHKNTRAVALRVFSSSFFKFKISKPHLRIERWCQAQQIIYRGTLVGLSFYFGLYIQSLQATEMKGKRIVGLSFVPRCTCSYKVRNIPLYISIAFIVDELCFYFTVLLLLWKKLFGEKKW